MSEDSNGVTTTTITVSNDSGIISIQEIEVSEDTVTNVVTTTTTNLDASGTIIDSVEVEVTKDNGLWNINRIFK